MVSGGSLVSWSATRAATTVTMQDSPGTKSLSGSRVNAVGPPLTMAVWLPLVGHEMVNQLPVTFTASLNVMAIFEVGATPAALLVGVVLEMEGAVSETVPHGVAGEARFCG